MKLTHSLFAASLTLALTTAIGCGDNTSGSTTGTTSTGGDTSNTTTSSGTTNNKTLSDLMFADKVGLSLAKGSTKQYTVTAKYADGSSEDVTMKDETVWNTSDPAAATVSKGLVTAIKETASVTISAEYMGKKAEDTFAVGP